MFEKFINYINNDAENIWYRIKHNDFKLLLTLINQDEKYFKSFDIVQCKYKFTWYGIKIQIISSYIDKETHRFVLTKNQKEYIQLKCL